MNHPTSKVDGVEEQHAAKKLADEVSKLMNVERTRTDKTTVWVYLPDDIRWVDKINMLMLDNGYIMDYTNGRGGYTFVPIEDIEDN